MQPIGVLRSAARLAEAAPLARPLRVALYLHDLAGGGAERMRLHLIAALRDAGAAPSLVLHARTGENSANIPPFLRVTALGGARTRDDILPLARYLRRERPDVLIASLGHNNLAAVAASLLARAGTKIILTQHNALSAEAGQGGWRYRCLPAAYRLADPFVEAFVAVSRGVAEDLAHCTGIAHERIAVIYNPVLGDDFARRAAEPCPHPWFAEATPVYVTAGRLVPQKDHATLLAAFARHRSRVPARLIVLGQGPLRRSLQAQAASLGIAADVDFAGYIENPLPYFREAAAFVLSSRHEGFGNVLVEALGCGTPVIATDCPHGPAEILQGGRYGVLVPPGDAGALAAALTADLRRPFPPARLRERAATFTSAQAAEAHIALIRRVLGARA